VIDSAGELVDLSETANELSGAVLGADGDRRPVDAGAELDRVVARIRERYPEASVGLDGLDGERTATVPADWRLDLVFERLLENAVEHAGPPVAVRLTAADEDAVVDDHGGRSSFESPPAAAASSGSGCRRPAPTTDRPSSPARSPRAT
jgi:signal transduction histidine kinase